MKYINSLFRIGIAILFVFSSSIATASHVLIINGSSNTSEPITTAEITSNLDTLHQAIGNTTDIQDVLPGNLSSYDEIWDIRFSNTSPITAGEESQYIAFLQGAGRMFVMGENSGFSTRNNSVIGLITNLGGGALTFTTPNSTQTVNAPFDQPNTVTQMSYNAPGGVTTAGSGIFMTSIGAAPGTGIAFLLGDLANATTGTLAVVFDVNFMQGNTNGTANNIQFLKNLIKFISTPPPPTTAIPSLSLIGLLLLISIISLFSTRTRSRNN